MLLFMVEIVINLIEQSCLLHSATTECAISTVHVPLECNAVEVADWIVKGYSLCCFHVFCHEGIAEEKCNGWLKFFFKFNEVKSQFNFSTSQCFQSLNDFVWNHSE